MTKAVSSNNEGRRLRPDCVAVVGLGLIGGSVALDLRQRCFAGRIIGVENNRQHAATALEKGLVEEVVELDRALDEAGLVIVATPVDATMELLPVILGQAAGKAVTDLCSTKQKLSVAVKDHPNRARYVGSHPMAGAESSGPLAATRGLFDGKVSIVCDAGEADPEVMELVEMLYTCLGMTTVQMDAATHDCRVAYISHLAHVTSYALALTTLEQTTESSRPPRLAGGGLRSAGRLAKSSPSVWLPILLSNQANIVQAIDDYMLKIGQFRHAIGSGDRAGLAGLISQANRVMTELENS